MSAPLLDEAALNAALADARLGQPLQYFEIGVSTEAIALGWARQDDAPDGALVVMDAELSARGRRGEPWQSVPGKSLAASVVLRPGLPPQGEGLLWLLASVGVAAGVERVTGLEVALKWPNDVLVDGRRLGYVKVSAHLGPGVVEWAVVTIRLNVGLDDSELPAGCISLATAGRSRARTDVLQAVLASLEEYYAGSVESLLDAYRARCSTLGARVVAQLMPSGLASGTATDVDDGGRLMIEGAAGRGTVNVDAVARLEVPGD